MGSTSRNPLVVGRVIGDIVDPFESSIPLKVTHGSKDVNNCCELKPSHVVNQPRVSVGGNDLRNLYTLVLVDPDAPNPSNPSFREYLHWLVTDIPETTGASFGNEIVSYESPRPQWGFIDSCLFYFVNSVDRECMLLDGDRISTLENLLNFTILDHQLLLSFLTVKGKMVLVEEPLDNFLLLYGKSASLAGE